MIGRMIRRMTGRLLLEEHTRNSLNSGEEVIIDLAVHCEFAEKNWEGASKDKLARLIRKRHPRAMRIVKLMEMRAAGVVTVVLVDGEYEPRRSKRKGEEIIETLVVTRDEADAMISVGAEIGLVFRPGQYFDEGMFATWMKYVVTRDERRAIQAAIDALDNDQALIVDVNTQEIRDRFARGEDVQINQAFHCLSLDLEAHENGDFDKVIDLSNQGVKTVALIDGKLLPRN